MTLILAGPGVATYFAQASEARIEERHYETFNVASDGCTDGKPFDGAVCFSLAPTDRYISVQLIEESPTKDMGYRFAASLTFDNYGLQFPFCEPRLVLIPDGAQIAKVSVQFGFRNYYCSTYQGGDGTELSPALYGTARVTLTSTT